MLVSPLSSTVKPLVLALALLGTSASAQDIIDPDIAELPRVVITAEEALKQTLGASIIDASDFEKSPPVNDLSEILRTMPGVNLTGNSSSGQRGNNRQIDIRGMGPENTLILVDGKPVSSRNAVRFGWRGERDSRGDTNWVPPEMVERVEILRGPSAARYGNGAAGGVVNIITKQPKDKVSGTATLYADLPQHSVDGRSKRLGFSLAGPISEQVSFRLYGNLNKSDADAWDINKGHQSKRGSDPSVAGTFPAGREGVRNKDINGLITWHINPNHDVDFEAGFSRQGNIYAGDTQNTNNNAVTEALLGAETNILYRQNYAITHRGDWDESTSSLSYIQFEKTRNTRMLEGLAGGTEGRFTDGFGNIDLDTTTLHTELNRQLTLSSIDQALTIGAEWQHQKLNDQASELAARNPIRIPSIPVSYKPRSSASISSLFIENNIYATDSTTLTPGLRYDYHTKQGSNFSPSLNLSQAITNEWTVKAGIARAYKAPNLYQSNEGYALYSANNGCWGLGGTSDRGNGCFLVGNENLKAETSINKDIGIEYAHPDGYSASLNYFRNDYKNKVEAGHNAIGSFTQTTQQPNGNINQNTQYIFQWENIPKAVVEGLEGNIRLPFQEDWVWSTNYTVMLQSKNKRTGEALSTIPKFTVNSFLDWDATEKLSLRAKATVYGQQKPPKYDYHGNPLTGSATDKMPAYALFGLSGLYKVNKNLSVTLGVDNMFDKRIFRRGNAIGVNMSDPARLISGAGAYTYNQPGRLFFMQLQSSF